MLPLGLKDFKGREETWNRQRAGSDHLWMLLQRKWVHSTGRIFFESRLCLFWPRKISKLGMRFFWSMQLAVSAVKGYFSRVDCVFSDLSSCVFSGRWSMQSQVECVLSGRSNACTSKSWIAFFLTCPACRICSDCSREAKSCHLRLGDMVFPDGAYRVVVW
jgi:hypothetical protein